jgi:hypothetical protein
MSYYARKAVSLAFSNLKSQRDELIKSIYPRINVLGLVGIPAGLFLLLFATALWILAFTLVPTLLLFAWMALQPYRLWLYFKSRMTGKHFSG